MPETAMNKRPQDQSKEERFQLLKVSSAPEGEARKAFYRQKEIFTHQLDAWKKTFLCPQ
ncbi:MAG: hypothetical protein V3V31_00805 [Methylococcales bacterium]